MYKTLNVEIVGIAPLLMHNGQTADPLNKYAKAMKEISGKRKKTEADYVELAKVEFQAGLYMGPDGPVLPSVMIEAVVVAGARKSKDGKLVQAGVIVEKNASLIYDGPRDVPGLLADEAFWHVAPVRIGQNKVIRTRPFFKEWSATLEIMFLDDVINERSLLTAVRAAGVYAGFGDGRPRFGRFALAQDLAMAIAAE